MSAPLPTVGAATRAQAALWTMSIATAAVGIVALAARLAAAGDVWSWWTVPALLAGLLVADFGSGLVHWGADTWGRDDFPFIGPRLLVPFRVHHINPADFLRRSFIDTNGDVALVALPLLAGLWLLPLDGKWGSALSVFGLSFCSAGAMTNQIHQWAHMPSPPRAVRFLQNAGLFLGRTDHAVHHDRPYHTHYCITTGWCNRPLAAIGFFRAMERVVTLATGASPRHDDERYEERYRQA